jgi:hypothetical protein
MYLAAWLRKYGHDPDIFFRLGRGSRLEDNSRSTRQYHQGIISHRIVGRKLAAGSVCFF